MGFFSNLWDSAFRGETSAPEAQPLATLNYQSGGPSFPTSSNGSKYPYGILDALPEPVDNTRARNASRIAYQDSTTGHALVHRFADTVIDRGVRVVPKPSARVLGISHDEAAEWAEEVETRFDLWAKSRKAHRAEQMNFYQIQRLAHICQQRDGEYFLRMFYDDGIQMDFIDPANVSGWDITPTDGSQWTVDGIKRDSRGRPTAYRILAYNPVNGQQNERWIPAKGRRSGLPIMIHGFQAEWPTQVRGTPRLFHALQDIRHLEDFTESQIKKAIAQSTISVFVKPSQHAPASDPLAALSHAAPAGTERSEFYGDATSEAPLGTYSNIQYAPLPEATVAEPGSLGVFSLMEGEDLKPFVNTAPAEGYDTFVKSFITNLASSVGMPPEVLLMKFDQSYSAARGALIMFWRISEIWREEMASDFFGRVYEAWLSIEVAKGNIQAPGWADPNLRAAWLEARWSGIPMPNIDPMKTAKADQMYIEMNAQTLNDVAHNFNGSSALENQATLRREMEGIVTPPWAMQFQQSPDGGSEADEDSGSEEEEND